MMWAFVCLTWLCQAVLQAGFQARNDLGRLMLRPQTSRAVSHEPLEPTELAGLTAPAQVHDTMLVCDVQQQYSPPLGWRGRVRSA